MLERKIQIRLFGSFNLFVMNSFHLSFIHPMNDAAKFRRRQNWVKRRTPETDSFSKNSHWKEETLKIWPLPRFRQ